jgi:hypothetical protein
MLCSTPTHESSTESGSVKECVACDLAMNSKVEDAVNDDRGYQRATAWTQAADRDRSGARPHADQ